MKSAEDIRAAFWIGLASVRANAVPMVACDQLCSFWMLVAVRAAARGGEG